METCVDIRGAKYSFKIEGVFRPMYDYEALTDGKIPFDSRKALCMHLLFWCVLWRANDEFPYGVDEFVNILTPKLVEEMGKRYSEQMERLTAGELNTPSEGDKKKV